LHILPLLLAGNFTGFLISVYLLFVFKQGFKLIVTVYTM